jgi:apolipoprotein D and lipocalin family protein
MTGRHFMALATAVFTLLACAHRAKQTLPPPEAVSRVDLKSYMGTWYEIARLTHRFQEGCFASSATYTLLDDGQVEVVNRCRKGSLNGPESSVKGKAWVVDKETNAKLKVSFFWPFSGDYWIVDLGKEYEYAVVSNPDRKYLWILSRTPRMDEPSYARIIDRLTRDGYDLSKLEKTMIP